MDDQSPTTLLSAWLLVPGLVAIAAAAIGAGVERLSGLRLGALTLPTGFLTGMVSMVLVLKLGANGDVTVAAVALLAVAGAAVALAPRLRARARWRPSRLFLWAALAGVAAYLVGLAPALGSGRSVVLGYVLNDDSVVHISLVEVLREHGVLSIAEPRSSFESTTSILGAGYPLGSHVWPLLGSVLFGVEAFHLWSPLIAVGMGMTALVAFSMLRDMGAPDAFAGVGGAAVACGYLPYSYLAQGSAKEILMIVAVLATVALLVRALQEGLSARRLLPAALCSAAAVSIYGLAALAWLGPMALVGAVIALRRAAGRGERLVVLRVAAVAIAVAVLLALPSLVGFFTEIEVRDPGNLLAALPVWEAFNVWVSGDYRFREPEFLLPTVVLVALAVAVAAIGIVDAIRRRTLLLPLVLVTAAGGALAIYVGPYSVYYQAKALALLSPALGLASAAGVLHLARRPPRELALAAMAAGMMLVLGVAASDVAVYSKVWLPPQDRFDELADINGRFAGEGPILVNERENYAKYLLRDAAPWNSWDEDWQPARGFAHGPEAIPMPHTPDFDDYAHAHLTRFPLLLERRRPGGSAPPANYTIAYETPHYRVWRRRARPPAHLGLGSRALTGTARFECESSRGRRILATARRQRADLLVPRSASVSTTVPREWAFYAEIRPGPHENFTFVRGGGSPARVPLRPGRYSAWVKAGLGTGLVLRQGERALGEAMADLNTHDAWSRLPDVTVEGTSVDLDVVSRVLPRGQSGWRALNLVGALAFVREPAPEGIDRVPAGQAGRLCGRRLDWVEVAPPGDRALDDSLAVRRAVDQRASADTGRRGS